MQLDNTKAKSFIQHLKESHPGKKVKCIETGIVYNSLGEAAKAVGLKCKSNITTAAKNPTRTAGGYHWEYI